MAARFWTENGRDGNWLAHQTVPQIMAYLEAEAPERSFASAADAIRDLQRREGR